MITTGGLFVILFIIFIIFVAIAGAGFLYIYHVHKKEIERIMEYDINVNATIDEEIPKILERFVVSVFTDYQLKVLEPDENLIYISHEKEVEIIREVGAICSSRLSSAMIDKLSLFWKREAIGSVIADKIYLVVVQYVAAKNAVKNDQ